MTTVLRPLAGLVAGLLFGVGLVISGMTDPAKVLSFLGIAGGWDPSLAFVMIGASLTAFAGYRAVWRRNRPVLMDTFDLPSARRIDAPLLCGAALFGIGWGIGGLCPGPAWSALALGAPGTLAFLPSMLIGLWIARHARRLTSLPARSAQEP